jgi:hypothetical protein
MGDEPQGIDRVQRREYRPVIANVDQAAPQAQATRQYGLPANATMTAPGLQEDHLNFPKTATGLDAAPDPGQFGAIEKRVQRA